MRTWTAQEFASALGITDRAARLAFAKGAYRGEPLPVCELPGRRGGAGGRVWGLALDATSPALRARLLADLPDLEQAVEPRLEASIDPRQFEVQAERLAVIAPILNAPKGSAERAAVYRAVASEPRLIGGELARVAEPTLREWVRRYEAEGTKGLLPALRSDAGKRRVLVCRAWDQGIDLPDERKAEVAAQLDRFARSLIANDDTPGREVIRLSGLRLRRLSAEAGSQLAKAELARLCVLTTKWVARFAPMRLAHMEGKDHKAWQDRAVPRIRRELAERPMQLLVGDVHYLDVLVEEREEPVRVRLIAWLDAASQFLWLTPVFLPKGMGIRQEDVARSLAQVTLCPHGGLPESYYLDNGSEYAELASVTCRLGVLADMAGGFTVHKAKAYSPQSKGVIEGAFGVLQGIYAGLPGYIGGDRTNKKSANKGQVVAPYRAGLAQLADDLAALAAIYNGRPQSGRSPLEALEAKIAATGFVARVPSEDAFDIIFSRVETRVIRQGMLNLAGAQFHAPFLDTMPDRERLELLIPLRTAQPGRVFVRHGGRDLGWAAAEKVYGATDPAGARRQAELERGKVRAVRNLRAQTDPDVSTFAEQRAAVERTAPDAPASEAWMRAIDKTRLPPSAKEAEAAEDARRRKAADDYLALVGQGRREASGSHR